MLFNVMNTGTSDIPRLYTAFAEWAACFLFCFIFPGKISRKRKIAFSVIFLLVQEAWLLLTENLSTVVWIPCMLAALGIMYLYLQLTLSGTRQYILYVSFKAFLIAEFMASLEWQLEYCFRNSFPGRDGSNRDRFAGLLFVIIVYGGCLVICGLVERNMNGAEIAPEITGKELLSSGMIVAAAFALSNLSFVYQKTPFTSGFITDIYNIRTLVDLGGLAILYAYQSRLAEMSAEKNIAALNNMLKSQYEHYRNYQDSIDLINIKYHDLKHQLEGLRQEIDPEKRGKWLDSMEQELDAYQPEQQTGNRVLDGVIDGKMALMRKYRIKFTCVADGKLLEFIHVADLCAIFGNALDNAIEHVIGVSDPEQRVIHLRISSRKQFIFIEVNNYCMEPVKMKNGYPVTTKQDRKNHGFGLKSIDYTVKKYDGTLNFGREGNLFIVRILIPMPPTTE